MVKPDSMYEVSGTRRSVGINVSGLSASEAQLGHGVAACGDFGRGIAETFSLAQRYLCVWDVGFYMICYCRIL